MLDYKDKIREKYKKILFIHGWGVTDKIWINFAKKFFYLDTCYFLNLYSYIEGSDGDLKIAAKKVINDYKDVDLIISWSLGCFLAKEIEKISKFNNIAMIYISYTPIFMKSKEWDFGFEKNTIIKLKKDLKNNKEKALKNFYLLMIGEVPNKKNLYKEIASNIDEMDHVSLRTLNLGLDIIQNSNYKSFVINEKSRNLYIYGDDDNITPKNIIKLLEPISIVKVLPRSSHVPFLSNSEEFFKIIKEFI